jgi:hypothetical protein
MTERTPIFRNSAKFAVPDFWGFLLFLARQLSKKDLKLFDRVLGGSNPVFMETV